MPDSAPPAGQTGNWASPPQTGTWPPPPSGTNPYAAQQPRNDSGEKTGVPPEIAAFKWNWGAWGVSWIWCFAMRLPLLGAAFLVLALLSAIPSIKLIASLASLCLSIYIAVMGHKLAWQNRKFPGGVSEFIAVQRIWMKWGIGLFIAGLVFALVLSAVLVPVFMKARMQAQTMNTGSAQPSANGGGASGQ